MLLLPWTLRSSLLINLLPIVKSNYYYVGLVQHLWHLQMSELAAIYGSGQTRVKQFEARGLRLEKDHHSSAVSLLLATPTSGGAAGTTRDVDMHMRMAHGGNSDDDPGVVGGHLPTLHCMCLRCQQNRILALLAPSLGRRRYSKLGHDQLHKAIITSLPEASSANTGVIQGSPTTDALTRHSLYAGRTANCIHPLGQHPMNAWMLDRASHTTTESITDLDLTDACCSSSG